MNDVLPNLVVILEGAWRRRYLILLPVLIMPIVGAVIGTISPKRFASHTSMLIQETAKLNPFLEDLAVSANLESRMAALQTLLHSRHILSQVALSQGLFSEDDHPEIKDGMIAQISASLSVRKIGRDLIRIDHTASDPSGMKSLLESVSEQFIEQLLAPERSSIRESEKFLKLHLEQSREELLVAEESLAQFRSDNADSLPELHTANTERLARINHRLVEKEAELAGAQQNISTLTKQHARTDPVLVRLEEKLIQQRAELTNLRSRYTDGHSRVQVVKRVIRRLEQERLEVIEAVPSSASAVTPAGAIQVVTNPNDLMVVQFNTLQQAQQRVASQEQEVSQLRSIGSKLQVQIGSVGEQEQMLRSLERDLKVKRSLYEDLLTRYEMAQVTGALGLFEQAERIKVIDRPFTPSAPSNLPVSVFIIAGLVGGLLLGAGLALFAELTDLTIRTASQVEKLSGLPVISRIPLIGG